MKSLVEMLKESINLSFRNILSPIDCKNLVSKYSKSSRDKKIFSCFIDFIEDKVNDSSFTIDEFKDYMQNEAFGDFLETYQSYGLKHGDDKDFDDMPFDKLCVEIIEISCR